MKYFNQSVEYVLNHLDSKVSGLSEEEVLKRSIKFGYNRLEGKKKLPLWLLFLFQFKDFMIIILMVAAVLSGIMGDLTDTIIILVIILLNAVVGFIQEYRAEKSMEALKKMTVTQTHVIRDSKAIIISSEELVPGDVVIIEAGNVVPADVRLMETHSLKIDESSLTGESVSVDKHYHVLENDNITLGDQLNMAFKGTLVTNGRAKAVVVATGMNTELGKIAGMLQQKEVETPLQKRMAKFGKNLSYIIILICIILFVSGIIRGEDPFKLLLLSISLAVAAIPEALPALITIALSRGAARLAKQKALVRKLPAVETLGSVNFICSDKTGTLTQNKMKVVELFEVTPNEKNQAFSILKLGMSLNHDVKFNDHLQPFGESTELAIVQKSVDLFGFQKYSELVNQYPRVAELPFDSDRKRMSTIHNMGDKFMLITKGASESISDIVNDVQQQQTIKTTSDEWAQKGIRVLAYSVRYFNSIPEVLNPSEIESQMEFIGLIGLMDPPREEVKIAIEECKTAGIKPVMITGDHPATAAAIAREIGILNSEGLTLTGSELANLSDSEFDLMVENVSVYARVSPDQKLRIVKALQKRGHFAAMTGDGVNDAPSLKAANIGIAMGINGTDVSKEAAHLILLDDNFATIVKSVKEGRRIFDNIRKFVKYIMTCNGAEIWTIFLAPLMGMPIPLLPIHILWINLVTDGLPALALANEKAERDVMRRPPRPSHESLFADGVGYHIIWVGLLMAGVTLATQALAIHNGNNNWQTMVFTVLSLAQLGHVLGVRSDRTFLYKQGILSNLPLLGAIIITFLLQMMVVYVPFFNDIFKTQPLSINELVICIGMSLIVFHAIELEKWIKLKLIIPFRRTS